MKTDPATQRILDQAQQYVKEGKPKELKALTEKHRGNPLLYLWLGKLIEAATLNIKK